MSEILYSNYKDVEYLMIRYSSLFWKIANYQEITLQIHFLKRRTYTDVHKDWRGTE